MIIFPLSNGAVAEKIVKSCKATLGKIESKHFPDSEMYIRFIDEIKGKTVVLVQSTHPNPNENLLELFFAGRTAKELGAAKVIGVVPYLCYMRQDKRFHNGECVSNKMMAHLINHSLDKIITIDPHLHRVKNLAELFDIEREKITANEKIAEYVKKKFSAKDTLLVGPDIESSQWAREIANSIGFKSSIFLKTRFSSRHVKINVQNELDWRGKNVVIIDDIISSGHTMLEAIAELKRRKAKSIHCICVHGIFAEKSFEKMKKAGAKTIVSTNTIPHKSNGIDLSKLIAKSLEK